MGKPLKKILYIEDDEDIAVITIMSLQEFGDFDVNHCASGAEALEYLSQHKPELILMDVMMPKMDGVEVFNRMKLLPINRNTPVIFMTARAQTHEQKQYTDMGAIGVIVKPFDPETLCEIIRNLWDKANEQN